VTLEIMRSRLEAITAEAEAALLKASFSVMISQAQDFSVEAFSAQGLGLAQSRRSVSEFSAIMPVTLRHVLEKFPRDVLQPGDVFITNDPWQCLGHLGDITIIAPVFAERLLIGFMMALAHHADVGGTLDDTGARDVFEEGIRIPIQRLYERGKVNESLMEMLLSNVRTPDKLSGDLNAQMSACDVGGRGLVGLMQEFQLTELDSVGRFLFGRAQRAMESAIGEVPDGDYSFGVDMESTDEEILRITAVVSVHGEHMVVDFEGTSGQVLSGINCAWNFTYAESVNAVRSVLIPELPCTEGCFEPIQVKAPARSILNALPPAPVKGRSWTGFQIQPVVFGALAQVVPEKVQAHTGMGILIAVNGLYASGQRFNSHILPAGGLGARPSLDGINTVKFPTSSGGIPVEIVETQTPLLVESKEFVADSGGLGRHRGGLGQSVSLYLPDDFRGNCTLSIRPQMLKVPAIGLCGGGSGAVGRLTLNGSRLTRSDQRVQRGSVQMRPGDRLVTVQAGGGGFGPPEERLQEAISADAIGGYTEQRLECQQNGLSEPDPHIEAVAAK
jgi:N-methylhydantoinase B/oxoprolinase/acetone carboxylase alpha subunit